MYFVQCDAPVSFMTNIYPIYIQYNQKKGDTGAYLGEKRRMQGHILGEVTDLEFQNHKNVKKCTFRTLEQAGTNLCSMGCQTQILR